MIHYKEESLNKRNHKKGGAGVEHGGAPSSGGVSVQESAASTGSGHILLVQLMVQVLVQLYIYRVSQKSVILQILLESLYLHNGLP